MSHHEGQFGLADRTRHNLDCGWVARLGKCGCGQRVSRHGNSTRL
jgi:hypothetical protein